MASFWSYAKGQGNITWLGQSENLQS